MANVAFCVILKIETHNSSDSHFIYNLKQPIQTCQKSCLTLQVCVLFFLLFQQAFQIKEKYRSLRIWVTLQSGDGLHVPT